jgi:hypothetical protein
MDFSLTVNSHTVGFNMAWTGAKLQYMAEREFVAELSPALINPPAFQES